MDRKSGLASKLTQSVGTGQTNVTVPHLLKIKSTLNNIGSNLFNLAPGGKSIQNCLNQTETLAKPGFMRLDSTGNTVPESECTSSLLSGSNIFSQSSTNIGCDMNHRKQRMFSDSQPCPWSWPTQGPRPRESWLGSMGNGQSRFPWAMPCVPCQDPRRKPFYLPGDVGVQPFYNRDVMNYNLNGHSGTYSQGCYAIPPMSQYPWTYSGQYESPFWGFGCRQANQHHATPNSRPTPTNMKQRYPQKQRKVKLAKHSQVHQADRPAANKSSKIEENTIEHLSHKLGEIDIASEKPVHLKRGAGVQPKFSDTTAPNKDLQRQTAVRVTVVESPISKMGQDVKSGSLHSCPTNHGFNCVKCVVMSDPHTEKSKNLTMFVDDLESAKLDLSETNYFDKSSMGQPGLEFVIQEVPSNSELDSVNSSKQFSVTCTRQSMTQPSKTCTSTPQRKKKSRPSKKKRQRLKERKGLAENAYVASFLSQGSAKRVKTSHVGNTETLSSTADSRKTLSPKPLAIMVGLQLEEGGSDNNICDTIHAQVSFTMGSSDDSDSDEIDAAGDSACDLWQSFSSPLMFNVTCVSSPSLPPQEPEVSSEVQAANKRWKAAVEAMISPVQTDKKISFAPPEDLISVHQVDDWDRKGPWEEYARDRGRFQRRIQEVDQAIGHIFSADHRNKILKIHASFSN